MVLLACALTQIAQGEPGPGLWLNSQYVKCRENEKGDDQNERIWTTERTGGRIRNPAARLDHGSCWRQGTSRFQHDDAERGRDVGVMDVVEMHEEHRLIDITQCRQKSLEEPGLLTGILAA